MVRDVLCGANLDEGVRSRVGEEEGAWEGWEEVVDKDVASWRKEIVGREWREMDWFGNIVEGCGVDGEVESELDESGDDDLLIEETGKEVRRAATGSMIQEKYNYLSPAKMKEYAEWRATMLAKIDEMIADGIMIEMDTTEG